MYWIENEVRGFGFYVIIKKNDKFVIRKGI
jgi:hypothetical protein